MENTFCNENYIQYSLVNLAAPVLAKQKPAGLITIWKYHLNHYETSRMKQLEEQDLLNTCKLEILFETKLYFLVFCYQEEQLKLELEKNEQSRILLDYHSCLGLYEKINLLKHKLQAYQQGKAYFPHEVGVFLGYPIWDVEGFIAHNGQDYKFCGDWKVYDDVPGAIKTFEKYDRIRKKAMNQFYSQIGRNNQKI